MKNNQHRDTNNTINYDVNEFNEFIIILYGKCIFLYLFVKCLITITNIYSQRGLYLNSWFLWLIIKYIHTECKVNLKTSYRADDENLCS